MGDTTAKLPSFDPIWEDVFKQQEWGKYPSEHVIRFVARNFYRAPDRKAVRLLDLGSGPGACTWYMAREGFDVAAIDGSPTAIERLKKRMESENLPCDARVGDIVALPWGDGTFDGVIENGALSCNRFAQCKKSVAEVLRVLKPGGVMLSTMFTDRSWGYGCGPSVEPGGFSEVSEGPLTGKGFILFAGRPQIDELFSGFVDKSVDTIAWSADGMAHMIEFWTVIGRKPS
jgi:SAM-dependent methyltransferase